MSTVKSWSDLPYRLRSHISAGGTLGANTFKSYRSETSRREEQGHFRGRGRRDAGYFLLYEPTGDFLPGVFFNGMDVTYGIPEHNWGKGSIFLSQDGQVWRFNGKSKQRTRTEIMSEQVHEFVNIVREGRVFNADKQIRFTVDGQTATVRWCQECRMHTPHGHDEDGHAYCGLCGTEN